MAEQVSDLEARAWAAYDEWAGGGIHGFKAVLLSEGFTAGYIAGERAGAIRALSETVGLLNDRNLMDRLGEQGLGFAIGVLSEMLARLREGRE